MIKTELKGYMPFVSFPSCTHKCEPLRETFVSHSNNAAALLCFTAFEQSAVGKWLNKHEEYETAHLYLQAKLLQNNNGLNFFAPLVQTKHFSFQLFKFGLKGIFEVFTYFLS